MQDLFRAPRRGPDQGDQQSPDLGHRERDQLLWAGLRAPFFRSNDAQQGMGEHRQGDMPAPAGVAADLVVIASGLALRGLEALLDRPPGPGDGDQLGQRDPGRATTVMWRPSR